MEQIAALCNSIMYSLQCDFTAPPKGVDGASSLLSDLEPGLTIALLSEVLVVSVK